MICPICSREIPTDSIACPACSQASVSGDPLANAIPQMQSAPILSAGQSVLYSLASIVGASLVLGMAYLKAKLWSHGNFNAEATGYLLGSLLTPLLLSWLVVWLIARKRNPPMAAAKKLGIGALIAVGVSFFALMGEFKDFHPRSNEEINQRVAKLAKEGLGQSPKGGNQDAYDDVLRAFFADIKKFNDDYNAEVAANDNSALKDLYTTNSFSSDARISLILEQLRSSLAIDEKYASMEPIIKKTKERLQASSMSEQEKEAFLKGFDDSFKKSMAPRDQTIAKERVWLSDSIDLYEFMKSNEKSFYVKSGKILFKADDPLNVYNERVNKVETERKDFLAAQETFHKVQREKLGQMGLKPSDFDNGARK